jgi:hypothetical protein
MQRHMLIGNSSFKNVYTHNAVKSWQKNMERTKILVQSFRQMYKATLYPPIITGTV